nr:cytochrome oxidase small assembly protein [uncultured Roseateles sp.]
MAQSPEQRKSNKRLALILASVALVFFVGFMTKIAVFGF